MKTWTETEIVSLLDSNPRAVERAIVAIWSRQTTGEKDCRATVKSNGVGFSAFDADRGSYWAEWINGGKSLSGKHLDRARNMAKKYRRQLVDIANAKAREAAVLADVAA